MRARWIHFFAAALLLFAAVLTVSAQTPAEPASDDPISDLLKETQFTVRGKDHTGMIWWIPVEFWESALRQDNMPADKAAEQVKSLREYVMIAVAVGKVGGLGTISFVSGEQVRAKTFLRDAKGTDYAPMTKVAPEAEILASVMKPILANAVGKFGEAVEVLFFPAKGASGQLLADPQQKGSFAIVLKDVAGKPESVYEWQLPLTALSPPKYCPVGKERVEANWNYCPWHGVPLNEPQKPAAPPSTPK